MKIKILIFLLMFNIVAICAVQADSKSRKRYLTTPLQMISTGMIRLYQKLLSPRIGAQCKFNPSCSRFGYKAITKYGSFWGILMASDRIQRCHGCLSPVYRVGRRRLDDPVDNHFFNP